MPTSGGKKQSQRTKGNVKVILIISYVPEKELSCMKIEKVISFRDTNYFTTSVNLLNLNLNSLLVKRQIDNPSPGAVPGGN